MVAALHGSTVTDRFGWHRDGWLGRLRQDNTRETDGHTFFAQRRILRWLAEPLVEAEFDGAERQALERLCAALPEPVPPRSPCLTHGDLWQENIVATGEPGTKFRSTRRTSSLRPASNGPNSARSRWSPGREPLNRRGTSSAGGHVLRNRARDMVKMPYCMEDL